MGVKGLNHYGKRPSDLIDGKDGQNSMLMGFLKDAPGAIQTVTLIDASAYSLTLSWDSPVQKDDEADVEGYKVESSFSSSVVEVVVVGIVDSLRVAVIIISSSLYVVTYPSFLLFLFPTSRPLHLLRVVMHHPSYIFPYL